VTASGMGTTTGAPSGTSTTTTATGMTATELARQANPTAISTYGLADYAARIGKYFGTAVDYPGTVSYLDEKATRSLLLIQHLRARALTQSTWLLLPTLMSSTSGLLPTS